MKQINKKMPLAKKMIRDWYLGLDIGTNSVGFSATDSEYNILTKNGKLQCGVRLFEGAQDASTRRGFRSSRRRFARRKVRIDLLQELFNSAIAEKDQAFFIRLNESNLHFDDKTEKAKYPLFNDSNFADKDYYKKFPTIYHLRKHLLENDEKDPRLIYLACHHLIKYRGHFLSSNFNTSRSNSGYKDIIDAINAQKENNTTFENNTPFDATNIEAIAGIIKDKSKSVAKQWLEIHGKLNPNNNRSLKHVFTAMQGNKINLSEIFGAHLKDDEKELKGNKQLENFKFSAVSEKYDECLADVETILNDDQLGFLVLLKSFYDLVQLNRVMADSNFVSEALVQRYNEHKADLKLLKNFIKTYLSNEYGKMFRKNTDFKDKDFIHASYVNYVGSNIVHNKKSVSHFIMCIDKGSEPMTANHEDFLKYTKSILEKASDEARTTDECKTLEEKIENKTLCKIHNTQDNSYIPYQLHEAELKAILEKQTGNFGFLQNKDNHGTVADKIVSLLTFRIPYYVGPLNEKHKGKFTWIEKNSGFENTKVLPWNFNEVVDAAKSGENFITRMTAKCTYLKAEDVIPKSSLLYQKYMLLNDLNNLKINGNRIGQKLKKLLYNNMCQRETSLSKTKIKKYLVEQGETRTKDAVGKENDNDTAFNSSLSSLIKFKGILGNNINEEMCENIIKWHTVFGDEKSPVRAKIEAQYGDKLTEEQIQKLSKLSFKGWARFSAKFLSGITVTDKSTGETALTIIKLLEETTLNLMEILNSDHYIQRNGGSIIEKFTNVIEKENAGLQKEKVDHDLVAGLYCSPTVKRSIWQAILICKELMKINGCAPKKVFIEVTRTDDKKQKGKMKSSRRKQIEELLNKAAKDSRDIQTLKAEFDGKTDETEFRSDRLYFYFTQLGKCMYSGEKIELSNLNNYSLYDIDHIYPQSKIKDDSLTNRVLVKRYDNAYKSDAYPIEQPIQTKMSSFWGMLKGKGLINAEKYSRLICTQSLDYDTIGGFINRQLVSTNQAVKETANALKILFGDDTKIVYSKASNVSDFRNNYGLVKCREVNNLHHAHDAYLNIVVGNVWDSVFGQYWKTNFTFNENTAIDKLFKCDRNGIWQNTYIDKIKAYLFDNKKYLDKFPVTTRPFEKKGEFYDQTIHPKGKGQFELHKGFDTAKYGGYIRGYTAYNCLIEYDDGRNGERIRGIFSVPVRFVHLEKDNRRDELLAKIVADNKIADKNPKVIISKIQMFSVLEVDGVRYHMRSGDLQCSVTTEWYPDKGIIQIIHDIYKYKKLVKDKQITEDKETYKDIVFATRERNPKTKEGKKISRENNLKLYDAIIEQVKKPFYANYTFAKKVKENKIDREKFRELPTYKQMEQLVGLLNLITTNGKGFNAVKIGGVANEVSIYKVKEIPERNIYLITQSVTGLFENRVVINHKR
ncbi:MAG: type II CRISPR RNA-guided endonuclease Cas9 [Syntrophobacterales bacterium]|jgi:CRISPR-associated endonuclease Csn1|nr:type II CRISPR RNA-guided endonuclease Cas9 [Syntrophobacterales bacterium]